MKKVRHPVPKKYHKLLYINEKDRRGNVIDFKLPPVIIYSDKSINEYKKEVFENHIKINSLPMIYTETKPFIILRPTAIHYKNFITEELSRAEFKISEIIELNNFLLLSDILYDLKQEVDFNWQWRVIMKIMQKTKIQDQNKAFVFMLKEKTEIKNYLKRIDTFKRKIRNDMGEIPVIVKYKNKSKFSLGIHHLHSSDIEKVSLEYNVIMHAINKTSVFS